jgi:citrate lyase subunit beta/citryl-CoA lyase
VGMVATQHVRTDVAQLAAPASAEQAKVPCKGRRMSVSEKHALNGNGIMVVAPVLRRAERIVQLAPHPGG